MQNHSYIVGLIKMGGNLDLAQELKFASPCAKKKKKGSRLDSNPVPTIY